MLRFFSIFIVIMFLFTSNVFAQGKRPEMDPIYQKSEASKIPAGFLDEFGSLSNDVKTLNTFVNEENALPILDGFPETALPGMSYINKNTNKICQYNLDKWGKGQWLLANNLIGFFSLRGENFIDIVKYSNRFCKKPDGIAPKIHFYTAAPEYSTTIKLEGNVSVEECRNINSCGIALGIEELMSEKRMCEGSLIDLDMAKISSDPNYVEEPSGMDYDFIRVRTHVLIESSYWLGNHNSKALAILLRLQVLKNNILRNWVVMKGDFLTNGFVAATESDYYNVNDLSETGAGVYAFLVTAISPNGTISKAWAPIKLVYRP